ncbi:discoidin domain-containing protein [Leptospira noumeaensis]|uniref:Discoidin domain-containing protein n=1 Tax=Leptospira noumeaensis TaxID=2484964 RepID=A0A4R9I6F6_9LEPT|nr:discoidin domain-containing protein [Leptospira noumeaensis]TGK81583.1 discoidin domain-containing protein [Leptospira noumeaensis]
MKKIILTLLVFLILFCKNSPIENSIVIERIQAASSAEGTSPINVFKPGKYWKPESSLDGITIFFSNGAKWNQIGKTDGRAFFNEISVECKEKKGYVAFYKDGSYATNFDCSKETPQKIKSSGVHVVYLLPDSGNGIQTVSFFQNGKKLDVLYPEPVVGEVSASSTLPNYPAYSLFDGSIDFAWVEGVPTDGVGESFEIELEDEINLSGIEIFNGYQRLDALFHKNGSVTELLVSNDSDSFSIKVADKQGGQRIFFPKSLSGKKFKFSIQKVRPGKTWKDTVIAEIILLGEKGKRFTVVDKNADEFKKSVISKTKNTILSGFVNKAVFGDVSEGRLDYVFRSNGSFVIWKDDVSEKRVLDGTWVLLEANATEAKIKIFGRDHKVVTQSLDSNSPYAETTEEKSTVIFGDTLTVKKSANGLQMIGKKVQITN